MRIRVSQDIRFCVVVDGDVSARVVDVPVVMLGKCSTLTGSVARASCDDGVDNGGVSKEKLRGCLQVFKSHRPSLRSSPLLPLSATFMVCYSFGLFPDVCVPGGGP